MQTIIGNTQKSRIRLGSYPYVNARVRAMRAKLLTSNDYLKLQKMSVSEITEFLQKQDYQDQINQFGSEYEGEQLLELALKHNLAQTYSKLMDISPSKIQYILQAYYQKFGLENVKALLRSKMREEELTSSLAPTGGDWDGEKIRALADKNLETILDTIKLPGTGKTLSSQADSSNSLQELEEILDRHYFSHMLELSSRLSSQGKLFQEFLQLEVDLNNINMILRLKKHGYSPDEISSYLLSFPGRTQIDYQELINTDTYEETVELLKENKIGTHIQNNDIAQVERALERYKLDRGSLMLHQHPLSINPVLGYMISKEAEVENLRIILQAKKANLGDEFITNNIIPEVRER